MKFKRGDLLNVSEYFYVLDYFYITEVDRWEYIMCHISTLNISNYTKIAVENVCYLTTDIFQEEV